MKKFAVIALACASLAAHTQTQAQGPAPQPSLEQMQQVQQMQRMQQMQMMAAMYDLRKSRLGFDETVAAIKAAAEKRGWKLGEVVDMQAPVGANDRVVKASAGKAPPLPCRATVFETGDGKINVVRLNLNTLAKGMQGELAKVFGELAAEEEALYKGILE